MGPFSLELLRIRWAVSLLPQVSLLDSFQRAGIFQRSCICILFWLFYSISWRPQMICVGRFLSWRTHCGWWLESHYAFHCIFTIHPHRIVGFSISCRCHMRWCCSRRREFRRAANISWSMSAIGCWYCPSGWPLRGTEGLMCQWQSGLLEILFRIRFAADLSISWVWRRQGRFLGHCYSVIGGECAHLVWSSTYLGNVGRRWSLLVGVGRCNIQSLSSLRHFSTGSSRKWLDAEEGTYGHQSVQGSWLGILCLLCDRRIRQYMKCGPLACTCRICWVQLGLALCNAWRAPPLVNYLLSRQAIFGICCWTLLIHWTCAKVPIHF